MFYDQFTGPDLIIFKGNIHGILIVVRDWVLVLEEDWVGELKVHSVSISKQCSNAPAVESKNADQVSPI